MLSLADWLPLTTMSRPQPPILAETSEGEVGRAGGLFVTDLSVPILKR